MTHLILAVFSLRVILLYSKSIQLLICMVLLFMWRRDSFCMGLISCKLLRFLFMFSIAFTSFSVLPPFTFDSLYQPICQYICGDFNLHHNEWLILVGLIKLVNSCNISVSNDVTKMFNLPTQTPDCDSQSCSFKCISLFWQ